MDDFKLVEYDVNDYEGSIRYSLRHWPEQVLKAVQWYGESDIARPHVEDPEITNKLKKVLGLWVQESPEHAEMVKAFLSQDVRRHFGIAVD